MTFHGCPWVIGGMNVRGNDRLPLHCCRSGFLAEWREWVVIPRWGYSGHSGLCSARNRSAHWYVSRICRRWLGYP